MKPTVNVDEAARLARVSRRSVYDWIAKGVLETEGAHWTRRVRTASLLAHIRDVYYARHRARQRWAVARPYRRIYRVEKFCPRCGDVKPIAAFHRGQHYCKPCQLAYVAAWYRKRKQERAA